MFGLLRILGLLKLWDFWKSRAIFQKLGAAVPAVAAIGAALLLLWAASRVALTLDAIRDPTIFNLYLGFIGLLFVVLFGFLLFYYRPSKDADRLGASGPPPPSRERLTKLYRQHGLDVGLMPKPAKTLLGLQLSRAGAPAIAVCGLKGGGKESLAAALRTARGTKANIVEMPDLSVYADENEAIAEMAAGADAVLFVSDQDLRSYEIDFLKRLRAYKKAPVVVIDKAHRLKPADREAIARSIAAKFDAAGLPVVVFAVTAARAVPVIAIEADGSERESERMQPADIAPVLKAVPQLS